MPANMTHFSHPLDITVNGAAKKFLRSKFTEYYSNSVSTQLESGKTLERGVEIISKGWKKSGVSSVFDGSFVLPPEDPFSDLYSSS